jgi:hypothetical protein
VRIDDLQTALEQLSSERPQRLEGDAAVKVAVGASRQHCPMVLAGFDPRPADAKLPNNRFAAVWDQFASSEAKCWFPLPSAGRTARRSNIQLLLRKANAVLAYRNARARSSDRWAGKSGRVSYREGRRS